MAGSRAPSPLAARSFHAPAFTLSPANQTRPLPLRTKLCELRGLLFGDLRHIGEHDHIHLLEILGGKRKPRHRADHVVLALRAVGARQQRGDHEPSGIARRTIDTEHRHPVAHDRHGAAHIVRGQRVAA